MTPEFIAELHRAADDADATVPPADPHALLALAKRRDRRRRTATAAGTIGLASTVVAAVGIGSAALDSHVAGSGGRSDVGPAGTGHTGHADRHSPSQHQRSGDYVPQRIAGDDVLGVCKGQLDALAVEPRTNWRVDPGQRSRSYFVGQRVGFVGAGGILAYCTIPAGDHAAARAVTAPIADESDTEGILRQCGDVAGFDFTGWQVASAMSQGDGTEAMLTSANGFTAVCALQPDGWDAGSDQTVDLPTLSDAAISRYRKGDHYNGQYYDVSLDASSLDIKTSNPLTGALLWGGATLFDHNDDLATRAATVTLSYQGDSITRPVVDGHVAIRWLIPDAADADVAYDVVVKDAQGDVLASYNVADRN
jgi:hypothetical protein